jgi:CRP/FNR family transcriptional regulator
MQHNCHCAYTDQKQFCISNIRLFECLPMAIQGQLVARAVNSKHDRGTALVREGDAIDSVLIIQHGKVKISHTDAAGEEHILDVLHDGQAIWHGIFLKDHIYHYDVICLEPVWLCEIPRDDLTAVLEKHPEAVVHLIEMLSTELDEAEKKVIILSIRDPRKRIGQFLLYRDARCIDRDVELKLEDIASSVNLRIETVSRHLTQLERDGYIRRIGRGKLRVLDRGRLEAYVDDEKN